MKLHILIEELRWLFGSRGFISLGFCFMLGIVPVMGQKFLQLEIYRQVETIKFYEGDVIKYKTVAIPEDWQEREILQILPDANVLLFEDGMINIDDITKFRIVKPAARAVGTILETFGLAWLGFGAIAAVADSGRFKFTWGTLAIGATAVGVGTFFKRIVANKSYNMGKNAKLRIIDLDLTPKDDNGLPFKYP